MAHCVSYGRESYPDSILNQEMEAGVMNGMSLWLRRRPGDFSVATLPNR